MALTYSPGGTLGSNCPDFELPSVEGKTVGLSEFAEQKVFVAMFLCNHCPYVQAVEERVLQLAREYSGASVAFVGICSNDPTDHPEDSPTALLQRWRERHYPFPYLIDDSQDVAKAFGAVCTPDFFVYGPKRQLLYRGRLDDSWRRPEKVSRREMKEAIDAVLADRSVLTEQNPSMGCSIKWKSHD
jgi:peroxiredoxin